jgi:hypothetical protein
MYVSIIQLADTVQGWGREGGGLPVKYTERKGGDWTCNGQPTKIDFKRNLESYFIMLD